MEPVHRLSDVDVQIVFEDVILHSHDPKTPQSTTGSLQNYSTCVHCCADVQRKMMYFIWELQTCSHQSSRVENMPSHPE